MIEMASDCDSTYLLKELVETHGYLSFFIFLSESVRGLS